jgi:hypothetical protein
MEETVINKIFCIGFHKTGTKSLAAASNGLGYRVTGPNGLTDPDIEKNVYAMAYDLVERYDAFQDNPWPILYKELDTKYPDSKFILTLRDSESWINSQVDHFGYHETPMRNWIYGTGCPKGNENTYIKQFEPHNKEVQDYFRARPQDLLTMDLAKADGWEKLCSFLRADIPNAPFPYTNTAIDREKPKSRRTRLAIKAKSIVNRIKVRSN